MPIKSFRGLMADDSIDQLVLHTNDGSTGYRIVKFELMFANPGAASVENVVKIYKTPQTAADGVIDFSDNQLIAAGWIAGSTSATYGWNTTVTFDNEIFNQDIYITLKDIGVGESCNYYIELEQMQLDLTENTVSTLRDIRNIKGGLFPTP